VCAVCAVCVAAGRLKCRVEPRNSSCPHTQGAALRTNNAPLPLPLPLRGSNEIDWAVARGCWLQDWVVGVSGGVRGTRDHGSLAQLVKRTHLRRVSVVTAPSSRAHIHIMRGRRSLSASNSRSLSSYRAPSRSSPSFPRCRLPLSWLPPPPPPPRCGILVVRSSI